VNIVDLTAGANAALGILLALLERGRSGRGQRVEATLMDGAFGILGQLAAITLNTGAVPGRRPPEDLHPQIVPYGTFAAGDGRFVNVCVPSNRFWGSFCAALDLAALAADPRFATNAARIERREELTALLRDRFRTAPRDAWIERLQGAGVPAGPVATLDETLADPYVEESGLLARLAHPEYGAITLPGVAIRLSRTPGTVRTPPPTLGEHTKAVLAAPARSRRRR
jgi:crotonobetainyl-CoA:carnitine CoA-transferase CaiB-like acyl-CoA transferase